MTEAETGAVLLDQRTGRYWMTNDTGALVLRRLLDGTPIDEVVTELSTCYDHNDPARSLADTRALVAHLETTGLVTR
jgi:hypothetical protein